jgi:cation/acetate symporter
MVWAEEQGLSRHWIGPIFLFSTVMVYAGIGVYARTSDPEDYYGRAAHSAHVQRHGGRGRLDERGLVHQPVGCAVPAGLFGTGAARRPGLSAGLDGRLLPGGHADCPHLRAMRLYTVPDFFQVRFGGRWPRICGAGGCCSFTYVVAQIYGVGLIASR